MKVEFVTSYFYPFTGGIENVVMHLADGLSKRGHSIVVHTGNTYPASSEKLQTEETYKNFLIQRYPIYPLSLFLPIFKYSESVISMHNYSALMNDYVARRYTKHKMVLTPYGTITYDRSQRKYQQLSVVYDFVLGKLTLDIVDKIIAMTPFEQKKIIVKYPQFRSKTVTIAAGIDRVKSKKYMKYAIPAHYIFSIGRIAPSKRFEDVIEILPKFPTLHYVLCGSDTGYLTHLQQIAKNLNVESRFHYFGRVSDSEKVYLMENATMCIMPSSAEAFSIASVEAFCYSKIVIGASSGGIVDVFRELEGSLYAAGNLISLTTAVKKTLAQKINQNIIEKRRRIIQKKYNWDVIVEQYEQAFFK
jgi:glycosyltransferase involved in cell wall biosynthesis